MTSPRFRPASAAGEPAATLTTSAPVGRSRPSDSAMSLDDILQVRAEPRPFDRRAAAPRRDDDALDHVDGNREADPHAAARARIDRRIDPDEAPGKIDQRAARIAGIDRGVGLDEETVVVDADLRARERRDDPLRHRLADAERIADREDEIADLDRVGIAELEHRELLVALDLEHRQIRAGIAQHDLGFEFPPIRERDLHFRHALDDVMVGDDEAARIDDHARAERLGGARVLALRAEELAKDRIVEQRIARHRLDARGVDVDDGRPRLLDDGREREPHFARVGRDGLLHGLGFRGRQAEENRHREGEAKHCRSPE